MRDIYNSEQRLKALLTQIQAMQPEKRIVFKRFHQYCITRDLSLARKINLLANLNTVLGNNNIQKPTRLYIYKMVSKINATNKSENTRRDYKLAFRSYLFSIGTDKNLIDLIATGNAAVRRPKRLVDPDIWKNMSEEHLRRFARFGYESGARPGELFNLTYSEIEPKPFGVDVTLDGKTGPRTIPIIDSAQILLDAQKSAYSLDDYVFPEGYSHYANKVSKMLKNQGYPDTYLYIFRKSRATELFSKLPEQVVKMFLGWSKGSKMAETYSFIPQQNLTDSIINMNTAGGIPTDHQRNLNNWGA